MKKLFKRLFSSKEMRAYIKMYRKHRRELIKHAKKTSEWDWSWLHNSIIMQVRHMHEYYTAGNNVWQTDETRLPIIEQLKHILDLNAEIDRMQDEFPDSYKDWEKRQQALYEELYSSIGRNLRWWWD